jgi:CubicO group peptidase (beta-lactamase class C family)
MAGMTPLLALVLAATPPALPQTPAAHAFAEWFALCNSFDAAKLTAWDTAHLSTKHARRRTPAQIAGLEIAGCKSDGGYQLDAVVESTRRQLRVAASAKATGAAYEFRVAVDDTGKLERLVAIPTTPVESSLPEKLDDRALAEDLGTYLRKLEASGQFSGVVAIARDGKIVVEQSVGYANREKKTPITGSTQFTLGSMGKLFTTTAIGQLVDAGKVSYDDKVGKFFPGFANQDVREKVTVGMLLSHTGGLGDFLAKRTPGMMQHGVERAAEFIPRFEKDPLQFEPGTSWSYSNAGLTLAGAIVEKVSGEAFPSYVRKHIFAPAGMSGSDPNNVPFTGPGLVTPYTQDDRGQVVVAPADLGSPAGGAISTAEDLVRFATALESGKLVSPATFAQIITPRAQAPRGPYGDAIAISQLFGSTVVGHGGGFPGVSTELYIVHGTPYVIVVLANQDPMAAEVAGERVKALIAERVKRGRS